MTRRSVRVALVLVVVACIGAVTVTGVLRARTERELRAALEDLGAPPGFRPIGATTTGSVLCFGPCMRRRAQYRTDMPFSQALSAMLTHLSAQGASKSCFSDPFECSTPFAPDDCDTINDDDPDCLMAVVVDGRDLYVSVNRQGPPTDVTVTATPKNEINLI
jgi:hypothetical protein